MSITATESESWIGCTLIDNDGREIGTIEAIYFDEQTDLPQWMAVDSGLSGSHSFVPLADAVVTEDAVLTPYTQAQIGDAPAIAAHEDLPDDQVLALYGYYGLPYDAPDAGVLQAAAPDPRLAATDPGTQSEHDMRIATGQTAYVEPAAGGVVYEVPASEVVYEVPASEVVYDAPPRGDVAYEVPAAGERGNVVRRTRR